jgi:uncharacterized RDD family membrane protein YckC
LSELVTGEAVVLEMRYARPATRALGFFIDVALEVVLFLLLLVPIALVAGADASESLIAGLIIASGVATFVGYATVMETLTRGKTVGKYALGLRVVRDDGGPVHFRHALVRALSGVLVDFFVSFGCVGFLVAMLNPRGKRVGDMLAGTVVVRERAPREIERLPEVPAPLASWATRADLSRVPDQLALSARSYLGRYHELAPAAREALGAKLAAAMAEYVAPPPPPGTPAWAYLAAVLGERRRRALGGARPDSARQDTLRLDGRADVPSTASYHPPEPNPPGDRPGGGQTPPDGGFALPR